MWPALFAAAVAASTGLLAKNHLLKRSAAEITTADPQDDAVSEVATPRRSIASASRSPALPWESDGEDQVRDGIFRFSSDGDGSSEKKKKKARSRLMKKKKKNDVAAEEEKQKKKKSGRRVGVCLKKRKTVASKCGSSSNPKDTTSLFSWGLNIGIMYMMTAGKAEINKLNTTMDETAKVVQELKSELNKRKASESRQVSCSESEVNTQYQSPSCKRTQTELNKSSAECSEPNYMRASSFQISDVECPSSVLTEEQEPEPEPEVMDMDQLEAELESELQKLPWCSTEAPHHEGFRNLGKDIVSEVSAQKFHGQVAQGRDIEQFQGVLPAELDQKLCHVLIEQQESQIVELESELQSAQSKLQEKETELQALKDCVKRLTQLSLSTVSDDENEAHSEQEQTTHWNENMEGSESVKPVVGMKRPIDYEI